MLVSFSGFSQLNFQDDVEAASSESGGGFADLFVSSGSPNPHGHGSLHRLSLRSMAGGGGASNVIVALENLESINLSFVRIAVLTE